MSWKIEHYNLGFTDANCIIVSQYNDNEELWFYPRIYKNTFKTEHRDARIGVWKIKKL